jgi:hypothetical protein
MTIAAGFCCHDGVVLCTDSEHTAGQSKSYKPKIFRIDAENATAFLAGAGNDLYVKSAADKIAAKIQGKSVSLDQVKVAVEEVVSGLYQNHFAASRQASDPNAPALDLLLALKVGDAGMRPETATAVMEQAKVSGSDAIALQKLKEELDGRVAKYHPGEGQAALYRIAETGGISRVVDEPEVIGTEAAEAALRELAATFFQSATISIYAMRHLAVHLIHRVVRFASFCRGSAQVACLADGGTKYFDNTASPDPGPDYLADILIDIPHIVESCINGRAENFEAHTARFTERLRGMMQERKNFLGQCHPTEADGWEW